jgi:class 3 adenylate cyclase
MNEARKLAAILVSDVVGYSRLAGADEDRILARLRTLRSDVIDPIISVYHGRIVKRTGDGAIVEFRSVVDAVRCAIEVQTAMVERNAEVPGRKAHRISPRRSPRRRGRRGGRRPDGRRGQHRRATAERRQARDDLSV